MPYIYQLRGYCKGINLGGRQWLLLCLFIFLAATAYSQDLPNQPLERPLDTLPLVRPDSTVRVQPKTPILLSIVNHIAFGFKIGPGRLLTLPVATFAPETSLGLGATVMYIFHFDKNDSTPNDVSYINNDLLFTLRGQIIVEPRWNFVIKNGRFRTAGDASYRIYPDYYYGVGNGVNNDNKQKYQANYAFVKTSFTPRVVNHLYLGVQYSFEDLYLVKPVQTERWDSSRVPGGTGYMASGLGIRAEYDTRDNSYYPFKGTYILLGNVFYSKIFGSNQYFNNVSLDVRKFFNPFRSHVIAIQGYAEFNPGFKGSTPPFRMMATFGGNDMMRGYYRWQYRDVNTLVLQVEYRFPIWWRLLGTVFGSTGDVFNQPSDLSWKLLKVAGGAGLRFTLDAKERVNIRVDCAWGRFNNSAVPGFYLSLGESF